MISIHELEAEFHRVFDGQQMPSQHALLRFHAMIHMAQAQSQIRIADAMTAKPADTTGVTDPGHTHDTSFDFGKIYKKAMTPQQWSPLLGGASWSGPVGMQPMPTQQTWIGQTAQTYG